MLLIFYVIYNIQFSHQDSNFHLKQKLLESWDGFTDDNGGEIVIDFYSDEKKNYLNTDQDENIVILPFFSDEELTLRNDFNFLYYLILSI